MPSDPESWDKAEPSPTTNSTWEQEFSISFCFQPAASATAGTLPYWYNIALSEASPPFTAKLLQRPRTRTSPLYFTQFLLDSGSRALEKHSLLLTSAGGALPPESRNQVLPFLFPFSAGVAHHSNSVSTPKMKLVFSPGEFYTGRVAQAAAASPRRGTVGLVIGRAVWSPNAR